jgi:phosphogluconate dehydratase
LPYLKDFFISFRGGGKAEVNRTVREVTEWIIDRSAALRGRYLAHIDAAAGPSPARSCLSCSNLAHVAAAMDEGDKRKLADGRSLNLGIVTAYNDMLSAHQPFAGYPDTIKSAANRQGATAQVASGVPAMCDGVTQGMPGMELSLFSRDIIAMSVGVGLTHDAFDAVICLGTCDKIGPGLLIGALQFPHLPVIFTGAGPMPSGISNAEKARVRQLHAEGKVGQEELLASEMAAYHAPGTCTFYGTANSNQVLIEVMGLHMPGTAFAPPGSDLRRALLEHAVERLTGITREGDFTPIGRVVDEKCIVNALVALLATGGSTNHTIHWIAVARAAGIIITWDDIDALSRTVPLLARVYPNGSADVNAMERAGGVPFLVRECLKAGLMHDDVLTVAGQGLSRYAKRASLAGRRLTFGPLPDGALDPAVLRTANDPFEADSGIKVLRGNLGRAVIKTSAVKPEHRVVRAPARIFHDQSGFLNAFKAGEFTSDMVAVLRFQGPKANGMPELHKLTPALGSLLDKGLKVALLTDGRMSGASGKVAAAIHLTPEAADGGLIGKLRDGDMVIVDGENGRLEAEIDQIELAARMSALPPLESRTLGRGLLAPWRKFAGRADEGASIVGSLVEFT